MSTSLKRLREDITGVATVSTPEVGKNIQLPIGGKNPYIERNKKHTLKQLKLEVK